MSSILKIVIRVINRRIANGEILENILSDYPKLTQSEIDIIKNNVLNN